MNNGHITVLYSCYKPDNAPTNRLLSFIKGLDESEFAAEVVFMYPDRKKHRMELPCRNVAARYLWSESDRAANLPKYVKSFFTLRRFARSLPAGENVLVIGGNKYLHLFTRRKDLRVFHERTEHPLAIGTLPAPLQRRYYRACRKAAGIFCITTEAKRVFEKELGCSNVHIINMTVDTARFEGLEKSGQGGGRFVAYCGTASNNKDGVDELLKAFAIVSASHPDVRLQIIGKTPSASDRSGNAALIDSLGIGDRVVFTGVVTAERMPQLLKDATVLALARPDSLQARGGFPTKLGEYLMTGNPVVVTAVGDIPLFLKDGESAYVCEPRNAQQFASALCRALDNPEEASAVGRRGALVAMESFNYRTEASRMAEIMLR